MSQFARENPEAMDEIAALPPVHQVPALARSVDRPTHEIYLEICRQQTAGKSGDDEHRRLNEEYRAALDGEIRRDWDDDYCRGCGGYVEPGTSKFCEACR